MVNLITLATANVDLTFSPVSPFSFVSMLRVNFFSASVTSTLYIYRVHDRGCTCTMPKPKKHWLHFLHRRPVDPYASRRYPEYVYTSWYRVSGIMAVPRPAVDSFLPNFTHRYTATQPLVAYTPPQHSRAPPKLPFEIVSTLYSSL